MTQSTPPPAVPPQAQVEPIPLTAEMQAKIEEATEQILDYVYCDPHTTHFELIHKCISTLVQSERSRCLAACQSEMHGETFAEVKKVQAMERKIKSGWTQEGDSK